MNKTADSKEINDRKSTTALCLIFLGAFVLSMFFPSPGGSGSVSTEVSLYSFFAGLIVLLVGLTVKNPKLRGVLLLCIGLAPFIISLYNKKIFLKDLGFKLDAGQLIFYVALLILGIYFGSRALPRKGVRNGGKNTWRRILGYAGIIFLLFALPLHITFFLKLSSPKQMHPIGLPIPLEMYITLFIYLFAMSSGFIIAAAIAAFNGFRKTPSAPAAKIGVGLMLISTSLLVIFIVFMAATGAFKYMSGLKPGGSPHIYLLVLGILGSILKGSWDLGCCEQPKTSPPDEQANNTSEI